MQSQGNELGNQNKSLDNKVQILETIKRLSAMLPKIETSSLSSSDIDEMKASTERLLEASKVFNLQVLIDTATDIKELLSFLKRADESEHPAALRNLKTRLNSLPEQLKNIAAISNRGSASTGPVSRRASAASLSNEQYEAKLEALKKNYTERLPGRIEEIQTLWKQVVDRNWDNEVLGQLYQNVHQLRGNAASFGFPSLGEAAVDIDNQLNVLRSQETKPTYNQHQEINKLIENFLDYAKKVADGTLHHELDEDDNKAPKKSAESAHLAQKVKQAASKKQIYLVDDDIHLAQYLALQIEHFGFEVKLFASTENLLSVIGKEKPAILLMDIMFPEGDLAGTDIIQKIRDETKENIPVIFFSSRQDLTARLEAVRAQGDAYFTKPVNMDSLLNKIWELTNTQPQGGDLNIVVLQKNPKESQKCVDALNEIGFNGDIVASASDLFERLEELKPDLLILGLETGDISGIDLAKMLRQQVEFSALPILFTTSGKTIDPHLISQSHEIGEDLLSEPIDTTHLLATLNRISHARESTSKKVEDANKRDPLTGFHNRYYFQHLLSLTKASVEAGTDEFSLLYLALDNSDATRQSIGLAASNRITHELSAIIRKYATSKDMIGKVADCDFVIIEPTNSTDELIAKAEEIRNAIESHVAIIDGNATITTCTIGITPILKNMASEDILKQAKQTVHELQKSGGNRIQLITNQEQKIIEEQNDTVVAEWLHQLVTNKQLHLEFQAIAGLHGKPQAYYQVTMATDTPFDDEHIDLNKYRHNDAFVEIDRALIDEAIRTLASPEINRIVELFFLELSRSAFTDFDFSDWIITALSPRAVRSERIVFEVSAQLLQTYPAESQHLCELLTKLDSQIAISDFDCSPGAFQTLNLVPYQFIKISEQLIAELHDGNREAKTDLAHLIGHGQKLHKGIIAPSVQYASILNILWKLGTNYVQGDFIHAPSRKTDYEFLRVI